ncbi:MAG: SH3 domain-containing protein [Kiritimatiellia bacterium]|nr:SH3 domain-containing protein [Kiritimatiellia bacterium]
MRRLQYIPGISLVLWLIAAVAVPFTSSAQVTVDLTSNRPRPYQDEVFMLMLSIRAEGVRISQQMDLSFGPDKEKLELAQFSELPVKRSAKGGKNIVVRRFRCRARAVAAGPINLDTALRVDILQGNGPFVMRTPRRVTARPLQLSVRPLPSKNRPEAFSGAVGQFSFTASASPTDLSVGDLVTVRMAIRGTGYMAGISAPRVIRGDHFKVYDAKRVEERNTDVVYEQTLVPQSTNAVEIGSISFSYFDPLRSEYRNLSRGPFRLTFHEKERITVERYEPEERGGTEGERVSRIAEKGQTLRSILVAVGVGLSVTLLMMSIPSLRQRKWASGLGLVALAAITGILVSMMSASSAFTLSEVKMNYNETVRFAPAHSSLASFDVRQGSLVRLVETQAEWSRIRYAGNSGWVPSASLAGES